MRSWPASAAAATRPACSRRSWTTLPWRSSAWKRAAAAPAEGQHAATLSHGKPGVLHGAFSYVLQDADGQTANVHSVSAGLDYPGVGPEHSYWKDSRRVRYTSVDDAEALQAFHQCSRLEGILPALETAHAVVEAMREAAKRPKDDVVVVCFSGRGDKDCFEVAQLKVKPLNSDSSSFPGSARERNAARLCLASGDCETRGRASRCAFPAEPGNEDHTYEPD